MSREGWRRQLVPLMVASAADLRGGGAIVLRATWVDLGGRSRELQTVEVAVVSGVGAEQALHSLTLDSARLCLEFEAVLPWLITDDPWSWLDALRSDEGRRDLAAKLLEACK